MIRRCFANTLCILAILVPVAASAQEALPPRPQLLISDVAANRVAHQIWLNETGGNPDGIVAWNRGEDFLSLGIGHFIWFPAGKPAPFVETFPRLVAFMRQQKLPLPDWLDRSPLPPCPWNSRAEFLQSKTTLRYRQIRQFVDDTRAAQVRFLVARTQAAFDAIQASVPDEAQRAHIAAQYARIVRASKDLYPLIDYVNFKGEGISALETAFDPTTGTREGWGLKQVLVAMSGTSGVPSVVLEEFAAAAKSVLLRRIRNQPKMRMWQTGWLKRVSTYRSPLPGTTPAR